MKKATSNKSKQLGSAPSRRSPRKSGQIAVTVKMLNETRRELKSDITTLRLEMRAGFKNVDAQFNDVDARFNKIDARFSTIDARFNKIDARFSTIDARFDEVDARFNKVDERFDQLGSQISEIKALSHRTLALIEEQNARNLFVLDGYASLDARLKSLEGR